MIDHRPSAGIIDQVQYKHTVECRQIISNDQIIRQRESEGRNAGQSCWNINCQEKKLYFINSFHIE
jgi:hypothetical protein